jgi:GGDEF domain-containing protein
VWPDQIAVPDGMPLALLALAADGSVVRANGAWMTLSAMTREDSMGDGWLRVVEPVDRDTLRQRLRTAARAGVTAAAGSGDWRITGSRGRRWSRWWWGPALAQGLLVCVADIDEDRAWEFDLWRRVLHGPVTRLVAHDQFRTMTHWALAHRHRTGTVVAVIVADVSGFSDEAGAGRRLAAEWRSQAAGRMLAVTGPTATAARVGTDEFAFLCHDLRDPAQASEIAGRIGDAARCPPVGDDMPGSIAVTVGIAVATRHDRDPAHGRPGGGAEAAVPVMAGAVSRRGPARAGPAGWSRCPAEC